jgi:hypothetical protein
LPLITARRAGEPGSLHDRKVIQARENTANPPHRVTSVVAARSPDCASPRHRHQDFLAFLRHVARAYPNVELHLVTDNYAAHKDPKVKTWLAANPRVHLHLTPTSASWLNLVEVWFSIIASKPSTAAAFHRCATS